MKNEKHDENKNRNKMRNKADLYTAKAVSKGKSLRTGQQTNADTPEREESNEVKVRNEETVTGIPGAASRFK
jgi:hypothetical protein